MSKSYWVVGSMFSGTDDQFDNFIERGYWYCWDPKVNETIPENVRSSFSKISKGDRVAMKQMLGRGSSEIEIRALGIVKAVDLVEWRVYVNWIITDLTRRMPCKNFLGSLHGPVPPSEWRASAFEF